jgi:hypothetical protein
MPEPAKAGFAHVAANSFAGQQHPAEKTAKETAMDEPTLSQWLAGFFSESPTMSQLLIRDGGILLLSLLVGAVLRAVLTGSNLGRMIDRAFSSPRLDHDARPVLAGNTRSRPVRYYGWLVLLSCLGGALLIVYGLHEMRNAWNLLWWLMRAGWKAAIIAFLAAMAARALSRRAIALIEEPPLSGALDRILPVEDKRDKAFSTVLADAVVTLVYAVVLAVGTAAALDVLGFSIARSFILLVVTACLVAALGVALAALVAFREPVTGIGASLYLKMKKTEWVFVDQRPTRIMKRHLFSSECEQAGETITLSNRTLMHAALEGGAPDLTQREDEPPASGT